MAAQNLPIGIFRTRQYFQQAVTYRQRFVSDAFESIFNKNLIFTLCDPILDERGMFVGLLFAAWQPGTWNLPLEAKGHNILHCALDKFVSTRECDHF
jgi:hypothetical protein